MKVNASVPARINIIGEHTDHFGGLSLTFSSQHRLELTASRREDGSRGNQTVISLWEAAGGWSADLDVDSNIPIGAGLSSSAALCVAIVMCSQNNIDPMETSLEAQRIENQVLRSNCGLMDQISITHSKEGIATLLDFSRMSIEEKSVLDSLGRDGAWSWEEEVYPAMSGSIAAHLDETPFWDMGTPERLRMLENFLKEGSA